MLLEHLMLRQIYVSHVSKTWIENNVLVFVGDFDKLLSGRPALLLNMPRKVFPMGPAWPLHCSGWSRPDTWHKNIPISTVLTHCHSLLKAARRLNHSWTHFLSWRCGFNWSQGYNGTTDINNGSADDSAKDGWCSTPAPCSVVRL